MRFRLVPQSFSAIISTNLSIKILNLNASCLDRNCSVHCVVDQNIINYKIFGIFRGADFCLIARRRFFQASSHRNLLT